MIKKKNKKRIKALESRIEEFENFKHSVRVIGFEQQNNLYSENEYD